ncbi:MAG: DUF4442 domain-containing protein [Methanobacteriota archaeon]|nr:MAG: DUF4442 domain-containing protein [Euryarchaeota archaeon]
MKVTPRLFKRMLSLYPPYLGAGIKIEHISEDWKELRVSMAVHWYNRNYFGTHFGGSLYSMVDPHIVLLLVQLLGKEYSVWDKSATIDFIKATRKKVTAEIRITDEMLEDIKQKTANGEKYLPHFTIEIKDETGELIARVEKVIYIRKKKPREKSALSTNGIKERRNKGFVQHGE